MQKFALFSRSCLQPDLSFPTIMDRDNLSVYLYFAFFLGPFVLYSSLLLLFPPLLWCHQMIRAYARITLAPHIALLTNIASNTPIPINSPTKHQKQQRKQQQTEGHSLI